MKKAIAAILSIAAIVLPQSAIAQTAFTLPHKWTDPTNSKTYIYIPDKPPDLPISNFMVPGQAVAKSLNPDDCGWGSIKKSASSPITLITGVSWANRTTVATPLVCAVKPDGGYTNGRPMDPTGTVIEDPNRIWMRGGTNPTMQVTVTTSSLIKTKANACGFVRVTVNPTRPMTTFSIGTTNYTLAAIPAVTRPMICRKVGTASVTYVPAL